MKSLINKIIAIAILIGASSICGYSQIRDIRHNLSRFDAIEASDGFEVSIKKSDSHSIRMSVDDAIESYVECYVKSGVLHIGLDKKKVPKDVKKLYKGKNSDGPRLEATVSMPVLKSLTLNDDSEFVSSGNQSGDIFTLVMNGSSKAKGLSVVSRTVNVTVGKNAVLSDASVTAEGDLTVTTDGKAEVSIKCAAENLTLSLAGNSVSSIEGKIEKDITVSAAGSAKLGLSGKAEALSVTGKSTSAAVDASELKVPGCVITVTGTSVILPASDSLELDLGKGAEVTYAGDPVVKLVKIQNATVLRK